MGSTFDRLINRPARTDKVRLAAVPDEGERLKELRSELDVAKLAVDQDAEDVVAAVRLSDAQAAFDELEQSMVTVMVHLQAIGPKRVEQMVTDMPATPLQEKKARRENNGKPANLSWNEDTFPPALLAACVTRVEFSDDPDNAMDGLTEKEAQVFWESSLSVGDRQILFLTAAALDQSTSRVDDLKKD